jgi:hypothetical protein
MMLLILFTYRIDALNTMRNGDLMEAKERRVVGMTAGVASGEWRSGVARVRNHVGVYKQLRVTSLDHAIVLIATHHIGVDYLISTYGMETLRCAQLLYINP